MTDWMPKFGERLVDLQGRITPSWRDYLRRLTGASSLAEVWAAIVDIRQQLADQRAGSFLPTTTQVFGQSSIQSFGTLADGIVLVQLQGDEETPAPLRYYGTDEAGTRGFHELPSGGVPHFIPEGSTFRVREYLQALFAMPIDVEGILDVEGFLIEVN